ncbi:hypothetical protein TWF569_000334 [Orbilia oligospora]|uniref:Uncharacterized protein n=1 Tax=Orbilia oligospora TaxID=2813651 RepID=A0A7C8IZJ4_ORBOL|nr:hypothetical protein TWF102_002846 [Orbilia oligospora]KAF3099309.1 hypothetical protein TWF103_008821 [Orbilia oligospora]KAF3154358.1 hypothetical protein TWF569_000334 [Orbilia oligospora]
MQSISPCKDMDMDHTSGKRVLSFPVATDSRPSSFDNPLPSKRARSNSPAFPIPPCRLLGIVTSRLGPNWPCDRDRILSLPPNNLPTITNLVWYFGVVMVVSKKSAEVGPH